MKTKGLDLPNVISLLFLGLLAFVVLPELFLPRMINPVASTRHTIEQCYNAQTAVMSPVRNRSLPVDLKFAFGEAVKQSDGFRQGYVKVSEGANPVVLDAWETPLQFMARSNLMTLRNVSRAFLANTKEVIIWSNGPNGINEFGNGDDVLLPLQKANHHK